MSRLSPQQRHECLSVFTFAHLHCRLEELHSFPWIQVSYFLIPAQDTNSAVSGPFADISRVSPVLSWDTFLAMELLDARHASMPALLFIYLFFIFKIILFTYF